MELDYVAIKALSAPTRIKILHRLLEKEATPTVLSDELGKSKSTIASHLAILEDAGLVEKDKREGRRRVTYAPTRKAKAIVEGRERTVKFSVASSVLSVVAGLGMLGHVMRPYGWSEYAADMEGQFQDEPSLLEAPEDEARDIPGELAEDAPVEDAAEPTSLIDTAVEVVTADTTMTVLGTLLLLIGIVMMYYGVVLWRLDRSGR